MRLVCPSCDARYEVPMNAIPPEGRDVQCSSCGQGWFQMAFGLDDDSEPQDDVAEDEDDLKNDSLTTDDEERAVAAISRVMSAARAIADELTQPVDEVPEALAKYQRATQQPDLPRPELNMSVLAVLREEAEREAQARRQEEERLAQRRPEPEVVQADPVVQTPQIQEPVVVPAPSVEDVTAVGARRDLLPNIEEITSTLQPDEASYPTDITGAAQSGQLGWASLWVGMAAAFLVLICASAVYIMADDLAKAWPQMQPALARYSAFVGEVRLWLDGVVQDAKVAFFA